MSGRRVAHGSGGAAAPVTVALLTSARAWRGSGVSLAHVAAGLAERGHRAHLFAGDPVVADAFAALGLEATTVPASDTGLGEARALRRAVAALSPDVLLADRPRDVRLGALAALGRPVALVHRYNLSRRPPRDIASRLAYRRVRLTIFLSDASARGALRYARYLRRRARLVIPNGVDTERFRPDPEAAAAFRAARGLGDRAFVLAVGALTPEKRHDFVLDALARLEPSPPLVVCGAGPLGPALAERADALGVDARFPGLLPPEELRGAYSAATCLVHGCAVETFGLGVLEAMACGTPVVAVGGGAVPQVLGGTGLLVPPGDAGAFAARVAETLADGGLRERLAAAARRRAAEVFGLPRMRSAYADVMERLAGERHARRRLLRVRAR